MLAGVNDELKNEKMKNAAKVTNPSNPNGLSHYEYEKQVKETYGLRHRPARFFELSNALSMLNNCIKMHMIVLGEDGRFWVVCPTDAGRLVRAGLEYAQY